MQPNKPDERHLQCLARLKELHAQSVPFVEARDILLKEGFSQLDVINGAYLFDKPDPSENPTLEQQNLNTYMQQHPEEQDKIVNTFTELEQEHEHTDKEAHNIQRFGRFLRGYIDASYVLSRGRIL